MDNIDIKENVLMTDRIQLSISIPYIVTNIRWEELPNEEIIIHYLKDLKDDFNEIAFANLDYYQNVFNEYLKNKKEFKVRYDPIKKQYYIEVPDEFYNNRYLFFSHTRLRMNNPYTITTEFNFNRLVRKYAKETVSFDCDYDKSIRVADDNYINKQVWLDWDNYLVKSLALDIPEISFNFAYYVINQYIEDFDTSYKVLTVKQIEFCKDYFVGYHRSADVLHQIMYFIISSSGVEWINKLSGYGISVYKAEESNYEETRFYGDHYNPTLKFPIAKGIFLKIYRKTTDHIRFEITFQKGFIKRKFGKESYDYVYDKLRKIAKDFFKKADFKVVLRNAIDNSYSDHFSIIENLYNIIDITYPELSSIADSVTYRNPISDPEVIRFINGNKRFRNLFISGYLGNGKRILIFNPLETDKKRLNRKFYSKYDNKYNIDLYREYKKNNPDDIIFLGSDRKTFIHKGKSE
jgi:hypothetical protein